MLPVVFVCATLIAFTLHLFLGREPRTRSKNCPTPTFVLARDKCRPWQSAGLVRTYLYGRRDCSQNWMAAWKPLSVRGRSRRLELGSLRCALYLVKRRFLDSNRNRKFRFPSRMRFRSHQTNHSRRKHGNLQCGACTLDWRLGRSHCHIGSAVPAFQT